MTSHIRAKKSLGQNFLNDDVFAQRIVDEVVPRPADCIIEIGPGTGALTRKLVEQHCRVVAVEIDTRLARELRGSLKSQNLSIITDDALSLDWDELLRNASSPAEPQRPGDGEQSRVRIVANLPYYISTPIIEKLLSLGRRLFDMTLMLQKEVADRIAAGPGGKDYGYLSVMVQYYCVATVLFDVPPSAFTPAPKVQSAVIRLTVRDRPAVEVADPGRFFALVKAAFAQRRKTILNNLKAATPTLDFNRPVEEALAAASVAGMRRAETLSLAEFAALCEALYRG